MTEETLQGFKYFRVLAPLLAHLRPVGTERDRAGNRQLFYDQYASLLLLSFFHPVVTSLRGLQQTTTLAKVQERLGVHQTSLSTLSRIFPPLFSDICFQIKWLSCFRRYGVGM
jgi:hypothetical protein